MHALIPTANDFATVKMADVDEVAAASDEAVVAVAAFSVNRGETLLLERPREGWRPGKDVAGTVIAAAADGTGPAVGSRVVAHPFDGGWAERVAVRTNRIAVLPAGIDVVAAAALPLAGLTAVRLLRQAGPMIGQRLLITGASGGVGHYVVELASAAGAEVTAVSSSAERGSRLAELGARCVVTDVNEAEGPFDIVMESIGGAPFTAALARVGPGGLLLWFGQASREPVTIDFFDLFDGPNEASIKHFDYTASDRTVGEDLRALVNLVAAGRLHPEIGLTKNWTETADVIAALRRREVRGNAILNLN